MGQNVSVKFLQKLRPGGPWVLTAIVPDGTTKTITAHSAEEVEAFSREHDGKRNLYFSVNPTRTALNRKAAKTDIAAVEYALADLDPNANETSKAAKARYLKQLNGGSFKPRPVPVFDYLDALWDGKPRVDRWLTTYAGAEDSEYVRAVGALMLIAGVRRIRKPGCKFDEMLVLEQPNQGTDKSSALAVLAVNDDWFCDDLPLNTDSKGVIEALRGRWIIEVAELSGMRKAEVEHVKSLLSRRIDRARMAYGRLPAAERPVARRRRKYDDDLRCEQQGHQPRDDNRQHHDCL